MLRRVRTTLGFAAALLAAGCMQGEPTSVEVGDRAPDFSLPAVGRSSASIGSDQLRGKVAIVNFWSTTCAVCLKETEDLGRIHDAGKATVVGIALEQDADYLDRFVKDRGIRYPVALGNEETFTRYDGYAVPYTLVLNRAGVVRRKFYGRIDESELVRVLDEIGGSSVALGPR